MKNLIQIFETSILRVLVLLSNNQLQFSLLAFKINPFCLRDTFGIVATRDKTCVR